MSVPKPSVYLDWVPSGSAPNVTQPPSSLQNTGWTPAEKPPPDYMNWLFYITDQWIQWLDYQVEHVINLASGIVAESVVLSTTGNIANTSNQLTSLADTTGIAEGQLISGLGIPANTYVLSIASTTVTMSKNATATLLANPTAFSHNVATGSNVQEQLDELDAMLSAVLFIQHAIAASTTVLTTTGDTTINTANITNLASVANLTEGMKVTGTGIPANTYISGISGATLKLSNTATASGVGTTLTFSHGTATGANVQTQLDQLDAGIRARTAVGSGVVKTVALSTGGTDYQITSGDAGKILQASCSGVAGSSFQLPNPATMVGKPFSIVDALGNFGTYLPVLLPFSTEKIMTVASGYTMASDFFFGSFYTDGTDWFRIT